MPDEPAGNDLDLADSREAANVFASDFRQYYANTLRFGITPFDIALSFGRIMEKSLNEVVAENQFEVRMSPQFFKAVLREMTSILATYERQFGEVHSRGES